MTTTERDEENKITLMQKKLENKGEKSYTYNVGFVVTVNGRSYRIIDTDEGRVYFELPRRPRRPKQPPGQ